MIAGGRRVGYRLLSRQVMEIQIPPGVQVITDKDLKFIDVHLATPHYRCKCYWTVLSFLA